MQHNDFLAFHRKILPALKVKHDKGEDEWDWFGEARAAQIFDCRSIPASFIKDAGEAALEEQEATRATVRLPYGCCYFEFDDESAVLAIETTQYFGDALSDDIAERINRGELPAGGVRVVDVIPFIAWADWEPGLEDEEIPDGHAQFPNGLDYGDGQKFTVMANCNNNPAMEVILHNGTTGLLGILSLLNEKLLLSSHVPDPAPALTKARSKKGRLPLTAASHVLRVNVGAIRNAAARPIVSGGIHESPSLHWRRGHWRILHRGSEFEGRTWVRKCLVGDPAHGFAGKSYKIVRELPLIASA